MTGTRLWKRLVAGWMVMVITLVFSCVRGKAAEKTTTYAKEAVTDLAVMNERGNYSASEYERILKEQKKMYDDMVSDLKDMLEEYRTNVNNNVPTAIQARDFMNGQVS